MPRYHGGAGRGHVHIPPNDQNNQYIAKDTCCQTGFTSNRFDEALAFGRITRQEVEQLITDVHESADNFKTQNFMKCFQIPAIFCCYFFAIFLTVLNEGEGKGDAEDEEGEEYAADGSQGDGGSGIFVVWIFFCAFIIGFHVLQCKVQQADTKKIKAMLHQQNERKWHPRHIHVNVHEMQHYIQIMLNFGLQQPMIMIPGQQMMMMAPGQQMPMMQMMPGQQMPMMQVIPGQPQPIMGGQQTVGIPVLQANPNTQNLVTPQTHQLPQEQAKGT